MMNNSSLSASIMSSQFGGAGSDPAKVYVLFDKIEKSQNQNRGIEKIEERSLKNIHQKLQHKLIDPSYLAQNNATQIVSLLGWLCKRLGECSQKGLIDCLGIIKFVSSKSEGKILLRQNGCAELFNDLLNSINDSIAQAEINDTMRNLVQEGGEVQPPVLAQSMMSQIPVREDDQTFNGGDSKMFQATVNPFQRSTFTKVITPVEATSIMQKSTMVAKPEHNYMETMHKQHQFKEVCELPYVMLCDEDEKILFDLSVQLKFGDFKNILNATQKLIHQAFFDYPVEVFLQRTDILRALLDLLEGSNGNNIYTNLAQPALLSLVQRLKTSLYAFVSQNVNKVSHMISNEREQNATSEPHILHCYPCNHNGKWQTVDENKDINRYGTSGVTAANLANSLSCKAALSLILIKSIFLLKDAEKIGLYIQLIEETLSALLSIYRVEGNLQLMIECII